jgi:hypothetical protein
VPVGTVDLESAIPVGEGSEKTFCLVSDIFVE